MVEATRGLKLGYPEDGTVQVGPLISQTQQCRMADFTAAGIASGGRLLCGGQVPEEFTRGCWFSPTLIAEPDPASAVVQEEIFGPVAVILHARDFDHALQLCNGVPQGLMATLMSNDPEIQQRFLDEVQAGILNINRITLSIDPVAPFGGWKDSGIGVPEHGRWDRDFYTQPQAVYTLR
jgi:alpha-ketoglutaric semialdehyde dehydrogenase